MRCLQRVANGKRMADLLSLAVYDKDAATEKGVGVSKDGSCLAVKRATILMYQAAQTICIRHEDSIRAQWPEAIDPLAVIYREIISIQWPTLARNDVKGDANLQARGRCFGVSRGSQPRPYNSVPGVYQMLVGHIIAEAKRRHPQFRYHLCR